MGVDDVRVKMEGEERERKWRGGGQPGLSASVCPGWVSPAPQVG